MTDMCYNEDLQTLEESHNKGVSDEKPISDEHVEEIELEKDKHVAYNARSGNNPGFPNSNDSSRDQ